MHRASVPIPCARGSQRLGHLRGGGWEQLETLPSPPCHQLPAAQLNLWTGKGSSLQKLLQDPLLLASEKHQSCHWSRPSLEPCDQLLLALWQQPWEKGAVTGAGGPGHLRYHSAASAGQGYLVTSTSSSGLYSLDFIWTRKC